MSEFSVKIHKIVIEEHPNADAIELAIVGGYRSIVRKGDFKTGDLVAYIPEQAIVPDWLIEKLGLTGKLAGSKHNRVKAIRLRGILSQGLILKLWGEPLRMRNRATGEIIVEWSLVFPNADGVERSQYVEEGEDVTDFLGIKKWEPVIPTNMTGKVINAVGKTVKYDIENWKNHPDVIREGEPVVFTEKLHGTLCCFGLHIVDRIVATKNMCAKGQTFVLDEENASNLYVKMYYKVGKHLVDHIAQLTGSNMVHVFGEIFGRGVQDLHYGQAEAQFRVFDIALGRDETHPSEFISYHNMVKLLENVDKAFMAKAGEPLGVQTVPKLYEGPFSVEVMEEYTDGKETISGDASNVREGIVMRPMMERRDLELGRVNLKSVSGDYLTRKGNVTEFQ